MAIDRRQFTKLCGLGAATAALASCGGSQAGRDGGGTGDGSTNPNDGSNTGADARPIADATDLDAGPALIPSNRVVRIHSTAAQDWDFDDRAGNRYYQHIDATAIATMLGQAVLDLTNQTDPATAWDTILRNGHTGGYQSGERVAIKVNNNNAPYDTEGQPNTSPELINAVISGLMLAGVPENRITVYDAVRRIVARQRDAVQAVHPGVSFLGGYDGIVFDDNVHVSFSNFAAQRLPTVVTQADHLINLHLMKGHGPGISGSMKNHFGTIEDPNGLHDNRETGPQLAEIYANPHIVGKSRLLVTEALFLNPQNEWAAGIPLNYTDLYPERTPNSIFVSANPVALDSVHYDYVQAENDYNGDWHGPDTWLQVAADQFDLGIYESGTIGAGTYSTVDLHYSQIDFRNRSLT